MSIESLLCISRYMYSAHSAHSAEKKGSEKKIKNIFSKTVDKNHIEILSINNYNLYADSISLNREYLTKNNLKKIFRPLKFCGICRICGIDRTLFYK